MAKATRLTLVALTVLATVGLTGCNPTGSPRCDNALGAQNQAIGQIGWTLRCDPEAPDLAYHPPAWVQGYADPQKMVVALWPDRIGNPTGDEGLLRARAWHEYCHAIGNHTEQSADQCAWAIEPIPGVSYMR